MRVPEAAGAVVRQDGRNQGRGKQGRMTAPSPEAGAADKGPRGLEGGPEVCQGRRLDQRHIRRQDKKPPTVRGQIPHPGLEGGKHPALVIGVDDDADVLFGQDGQQQFRLVSQNDEDIIHSGGVGDPDDPLQNCFPSATEQGFAHAHPG